MTRLRVRGAVPSGMGDLLARTFAWRIQAGQPAGACMQQTKQDRPARATRQQDVLAMLIGTRMR
jgi:hypothetical protein